MTVLGIGGSYDRCAMRVAATTKSPVTTEADTVAVALLQDEGIPHDTPEGALAALVESGEARATPRHLALTHAGGKRWLVVGLGRREDLDGERARAAAAAVVGRARELGTRTLCWEAPHRAGDDVVAALVEGTVLAAYRFDRYKRAGGDEEDGEDGGRDGLQELVVSDHDDRSGAVGTAAVVAEAQNRARDLQNRPPNDLTPAALGEHARALAGELEHVTAEVHGRDVLAERGMGAFLAVAQGSATPPALIVLRYEPPGAAAGGPVLGLVGKAVTFDSGGLSLKPPNSMPEMKFDMSGGAAVIEAVGAIARLGLPVRLVAVVGATENMPSGSATRPGDIVRASDGTTIQVDNTDAEGRLVLADCLLHARELGAERLVDLATLTGAMVIALGSTYAGLMSNDDEWAGLVQDAAAATGDRVWRMPLHREYADMVRGRYADLTNRPEGRKAGAITAAEFLHRFAGDVPWAHLDIAGVANDAGRPWAPKAGTGFGVRLLVDLARRTASRS
jgi:leucyl aminopeptidase